MTPRKVYSSTNICCLCGFSFIVKEIDENGKSTVKKFSKLKLRLSEEKRAAISQVTTIPDNTDGVCTKCFSKVEKVIKYRKEISAIISQFEENMKRNMSKTPGSRKKRLLRSPQATVPEAKSVHICEGIVPTHEIHNISTCQHLPLLPKPEESPYISLRELPGIVQIEDPHCTGMLADKSLNAVDSALP